MVQVCIAAFWKEKLCLGSKSSSMRWPSLPAPWTLTMREEGVDVRTGRRVLNETHADIVTEGDCIL